MSLLHISQSACSDRSYFSKKTNGTDNPWERFPNLWIKALPCMWSKLMTFPTQHIGHSRHGLFFTRRIVNPMLNLLKRTMTYPVVKPRTFGLHSALLTTTPFRSSEFSNNPENHGQGETALCHQLISKKKHSYTLKDFSDFIYKSDEAEWPQMAALKNTRRNQNIPQNTVSKIEFTSQLSSIVFKTKEEYSSKLDTVDLPLTKSCWQSRKRPFRSLYMTL
jgi:hypothetical protein